MDSTDIKNKLVLDPAKFPAVATALSKLEPGDKLTFEVEVTLEEAGDKVLSLQVADAEIVADESPKQEAAGEGEEAEPAAVKLFKKKKAVEAEEE